MKNGKIDGAGKGNLIEAVWRGLAAELDSIYKVFIVSDKSVRNTSFAFRFSTE